MSFSNDQDQVAAGSYQEEGAVATETPDATRRASTFDLRGPGMAQRRKNKPATLRQRILIAHVMVRAMRSWDDIKETLATIETQEDVHVTMEILQQEIAEMSEAQQQEIKAAKLASYSQWAFIGDLIADQDLSPEDAEGLWRDAVTKEGAKTVISRLLGKEAGPSVA